MAVQQPIVHQLEGHEQVLPFGRLQLDEVLLNGGKLLVAILELPRGRVADEAVSLRLEERLVVVLDCRLERRLLVEFAAAIGLKETREKGE